MRETISKADWLLAQQCRTMAWHGLRADASTPDEANRFRMEQGQEVGALARQLYPTGQLARNVAATEALLADGATSAIFEAAFASGRFVAKADVLAREGNGWHVVETKSSFSDSKKIRGYIRDLAYTVMVLRRSGVNIVRASLSLLSRDYRHGQPPEDLFVLVDVTEDVLDLAKQCDESANELAQELFADDPPAARLVSACRQCDFYSTVCLGTGYPHTVLELPRLHHTKLKRLSDEGIIEPAGVPADLRLNAKQERALAAMRSGAEVLEDGLTAALNALQWPCHYLDFETVATVMPLYKGHGCHQQVVTQFSIHHRHVPDGELQHDAFLADAARNEERRLAKALIRILGGAGSIIVYSRFEKTRISALGKAFPDMTEQMDAIATRIVDLSALIENHVYHPAFRGSFSIKAVLPVLVPELSYSDLAISDGDTAITKFARMARGEIPEDAIGETRDQLLAYCQMDTLAMVRVHDALLVKATELE